MVGKLGSLMQLCNFKSQQQVSNPLINKLSMKFNRWGSKRIAHTHIPKMETAKHIWNQQQVDISFFYKIKGSVRLLQPVRQSQQKQIPQQLFGTRFNISKRIQALSQSRMRNKRNSLKDRQPERPTNTIQLLSHRASLHNTNSSKPSDSELSNINKTISGTRIGALSSLQIIKKLDQQNNIKQSQQLLNFHQSLNQIQTQSYDQILQQFTTPYAITKRTQNVSVKSNRKAKMPKKSKNSEQLLQTIFGGQQFLQKHKQYQTVLMQKSVQYKSKRLSLDYKNQWRI